MRIKGRHNVDLIKTMADKVVALYPWDNIEDGLTKGTREEKFLALIMAYKKVEGHYFDCLSFYYKGGVESHSPLKDYKNSRKKRFEFSDTEMLVEKLDALFSHMSCHYEDCLEQPTSPLTWKFAAQALKRATLEHDLYNAHQTADVHVQILQYLPDETSQPHLGRLKKYLENPVEPAKNYAGPRVNSVLCQTIADEILSQINELARARAKEARNTPMAAPTR